MKFNECSTEGLGKRWREVHGGATHFRGTSGFHSTIKRDALWFLPDW